MKWARVCPVLFAWLILPHIISAQNLVPNGGFEEYVVCPGGYSQHPAEFRVISWRALTSGSPDYFNTCSDGEAAVPYNWAGVSDAFEGNGYVGIYTWMNLAKDYREYLHCRLIEPLIKDSLYHIEFRYKLSSYSKYSTDRIGLLLSDSLKTFNHDKPLKIGPSIDFVKDSALTPETGAWELAAAEYRAKGSEQFLTIGNFSDNANTQHYHIQFRPAPEPMLANSAYYYIDDVKIFPGFSTSEPVAEPPVFTGDEPDLNTTYVLKNIQFEFNSYALLPDSYYDLDMVVKFLLKSPELSVEVTGHTDDLGEDHYNEVLSLNRAKSAATYLMTKGIEKGRISVFGYGELKPLVHEFTEQARTVNRRVEIKFQH